MKYVITKYLKIFAMLLKKNRKKFGEIKNNKYF